MSDEVDLPENPVLPTRGRPRRSRRPATDGVPEEERVLLTEGTIDTTDGEQDTPRPAGSDTEVVPTKRSTSAGSDDWWREQRPPHWG